MLSLGVFKDECSKTRNLYFSLETNERILEGSGIGFDNETKKDIVGFFLVGIAITLAFFFCYCMLKHRGKLCNKKK